MLVFLRTLYGISCVELITFIADAFLPTLHRALVFLLRCCGDLRCAIRGFCEGGFSRARDCNLRARHVGATERRSGFRPRDFEKVVRLHQRVQRTQLLGWVCSRRERSIPRSFTSGLR